MRRPEQQLHRAVVQLLQVYQGRGLLAFCHVPNGGYRSPTEAGIFTGLGVCPGVADLLIWTAGDVHLQIELKAPGAKNRFSPAQLEWAERMARMHVAVHVCRSVDDVEAVLRIHGVPPVGRIDARPPQSVADASEGVSGRVFGPHPLSSHHSARKSEIP